MIDWASLPSAVKHCCFPPNPDRLLVPLNVLDSYTLLSPGSFSVFVRQSTSKTSYYAEVKKKWGQISTSGYLFVNAERQRNKFTCNFGSDILRLFAQKISKYRVILASV
jgi:hypothetical protein